MQVATKAAGRRRNASRRRLTLTIGLGMLAIAIIVCVAAPLFAKDSPTAIDALRPLAGPFSPGHLLGTDQYGRDVFARILYGGRIDPGMAVGAARATPAGGARSAA